MHVLLFAHFLDIFADNFILSKTDFNTLFIDKHAICSKYLHNNMALQISFPGTYVYKLIYEDENVRLIDKTVYLKRKQNTKMHVYLSLHTKKYGLYTETWILAFTLLGLFVSFFVPTMLVLFVSNKTINKI